MKKHPLILAGLMILAGIAGVSRADTIVSVTETHYDTYLRPDCVAVRMNTATFADAASNACALKTAGTQGADRITKTVYDAAGQVTQVIQAYGTANQRAYSTFSYSGNGKVIDIIDANGNRSHNVYDGFDRLITFYYPSTTRPTAFNVSTQATALSTAGAYNAADYEAFTYDNNGNRLTTRRRDGQILTDCYDALNRQIVHYVHSQSGCTATGGAKDVYTTYDLQGHILTKRFASTSGSGVSYAYDGLGRVASSTDMFNRTVSYQYNQAGARTRLTDNEGYYVAYALDNLNRLTQATLNGTTNVLYGQTFNSLGQRTLLSRGASSAGGSTTYAYDNLSRLQGIAIDTAGTSYDVTWGKVGAVGSVAYNPAGQITNWASSNTIFDYAEIAGTTDARTYDGLNRDAGVAALTGGYDARGNLTTDGTRTFTYDVENRLLTSTGGTNPLTLVYDPEGRLARVTSGSTTKDFLYDGVDLIAEYNSNGTVAARYIHGPGTDDPLVWLQGADDSDRRYYYTNYQGSLIGYTGSTGSFATSSLTKYGAYGEPRNSNNVESWPASRFGYTGQMVLADAKLYYYKARVYDPVFGRFLQTDPVGSKDDLDLYSYVHGDPINGTDPTGLDTRVTVLQYSVFEKGTDTAGKPHHMYILIEDTDTGQQWIARGGPNAKGVMFAVQGLTDTLKLTSEVTSAAKSQDTQVIAADNKIVTMVDSTVLKGASGSDVAGQAQAYSDAVNKAGVDYTAHSNSNSFAAGAYKDLTGKTVGNADNWGKDRDPTKPDDPLSPQQHRCQAGATSGCDK